MLYCVCVLGHSKVRLLRKMVQFFVGEGDMTYWCNLSMSAGRFVRPGFPGAAEVADTVLAISVRDGLMQLGRLLAAMPGLVSPLRARIVRCV